MAAASAILFPFGQHGCHAGGGVAAAAEDLKTDIGNNVLCHFDKDHAVVAAAGLPHVPTPSGFT